MELNRTRRWFYYLTLLGFLFIFVLGAWWLYLVFELGSIVSKLNIPQLLPEGRFLFMLQTEGLTFFILLFVITICFFYLYFQDLRKTHSIQAFFSSLTHELKTPLASVRLQSEVIHDILQDELTAEKMERLKKISERLTQDAENLESELNKSLHLSMVERKSKLPLERVPLIDFLKKFYQSSSWPFEIQFQSEKEEYFILADPRGLEIIFRNLFENTQRHQPESSVVKFSIQATDEKVQLRYQDGGGQFEGDTSKLGSLFFRSKNSKGSGIGLYLVKSLLTRMGGGFQVENNSQLTFCLSFKRDEQ